MPDNKLGNDEIDNKVLHYLESQDEIKVIEELEDYSLIEFEEKEESDKEDKNFETSKKANESTNSESNPENEYSQKGNADTTNDNSSNNQGNIEVKNQDKTKEVERNANHEDYPKIWQGYVENTFIKYDEEQDDNQNNEEDINDSESEEDSSNNNDTDVETNNPKTDEDSEDNSEDQTESENDSESDSNSEKDKDSQNKDKEDRFSNYSNDSVSYNGVALKNKTHVYSKQSRDSDILKSYSEGAILKYSYVSDLNDNWYRTGVFINGKKQIGYIHKSDVENIVDNPESLQGIGKKSPTHVYSSASTSSKSLKSYKKGSILKYSTFSENWYRTGVFINGKKQTGYIHKSDVENPVENPESLEGIGVKSPTHVYSSASTSSKSLKSYKKGSILKYSTFSEDWYRTGVFINGKKQTGYIHKSDVENPVENPESLEGIGTKSPTHVYSSASTSSKSLKSYKAGSILKYSTFSKDWYKTGVFIDGEKQTGYIHKSHVENINEESESLFGVALSAKVNVYTRASKNSKPLKGYKKGKVLKYSTFSKNWYKTGVFINGKKHTGYIHKSDVGTPDNPEKLRGIGLKQPTKVYEEPFTSSKALKDYSQGHILQFSSYANGWYQTGVYLNGEYKRGYIKASDVEQAVLEESQKLVEGFFATKDPTKVYQKASRNTKVIKTYKKGHSLKFRVLSKNWYQARVKVDGSYQTGFIHADDVGQQSVQYKSSKYNLTLNNMVKSQVNNPTKPATTHPNMYVKKSALKKSNGKWQVKGKNHKVFSGPGQSYDQVGTIDERYTKSSITVYESSSTNTYYKIQAWITPLEKEIRQYVDPSNFVKGSKAYYQFAVLSEPVNSNVDEVNKKILSNKGVFDGKASSFKKAAESHNINELYLISHAMLETGNGTSALATGGKYKGKTVYNMYGIGAVDNCPIECGRERAYEEGWFTPEAAIIGGAQFVSENYIHAGQDTLYKMRWDPTSVENSASYYHQYATDVGWAVKQTDNLSKYYGMLDNYTVTFDVPKYK